MGLGLIRPGVGLLLEPLLWPLLGALLYSTFTQIPLTRLRHGFADWRFLGALLTGNFVVIPLFVGEVIEAAAGSSPTRPVEPGLLYLHIVLHRLYAVHCPCHSNSAISGGP